MSQQQQHTPWSGAVLAYPMHGQRKLSDEGYRTRDGHVIEWLGRSFGSHGGVDVVSRPEPAIARRPRSDRSLAPGTHPHETRTFRFPNPFSRRRWWVTATAAYPRIAHIADATPAIVWNPFTALAPAGATPFADSRVTVLDLLDDWSKHYAFAPIAAHVERAYAAAFERATHVTANAEGTAELARRFGRDDVILVPNGCDPERFSPNHTATGPTTVGYVGKIGRRLDLPGIVATITALPHVRFVFAGPILDAEYRAPLAALGNVELLGDVHYSDVPELLEGFDVGWVPHRVGAGEVGGDIIKTYEYRAAGLPTLTTPVAGAGTRGIDGVTTTRIHEHAEVIGDWTRSATRVPRTPTTIPVGATWRDKTDLITDLLVGSSVGVSR
ncbi:glycosyltransferase [Curtobacterium sp. PhB136]|uniref:glycosyltransferase n=1 Tax=Curtobacterium sp. PhB136 TaxID=2485181 RepID=UPI0010D10630|nr:glycosyltransferase [Curtobacterium sp. PhB136]TCK65420.1 glycosyl transferase family 1 [Curtobacterium sp. PhB136]